MQTFTDKTLTSANSVLLFRAKGYVDQYAHVQGYQADNAFSLGDATMGETVMGVDGFQSGAWLPHEREFTIFLQANSPSQAHFANIFNRMNKDQETTAFEFTIELPSVKKRYIAKGFPTIRAGVSAKKMIEQGTYTFRLGEVSEEDIA